MITDLEDYIEAHISSEPENLKRIDRLTNLGHINGRMCSGHIQGRLLKMLVAMIKPKRVLELGTFTGYSALCMAEGLEEDARIDTVEADDELEEIIIENFSSSSHGGKITLHIGDALEVMDQWSENEFDLVLIDADKRQYSDYFQKAINLVKTGGFIIADNTLWDGHVTETCKHSGQTSGIIDFNDLVASYPGIEVAMIPIRDGITLIRKME
ncbi:MAG: class I SAM-dependent methyltransferase [Muribaculaceae bacterium]|nr:class I SAM-dependent methyltransferase [Muribaculaceae bacterium]